jgi:NTP pyrophosphatase (non-canonical NTP hydrolase)
MTPNEYQQLAILTENQDFKGIAKRLQNPQTIRLLHAAIGLATESGELLDALKKHIFYGRELDVVNVKEELGDAQWYVATGVDACAADLMEVMITNIQKLRARYPDKFKEADALQRNLEQERLILEGKNE